VKIGGEFLITLKNCKKAGGERIWGGKEPTADPSPQKRVRPKERQGSGGDLPGATNMKRTLQNREKKEKKRNQQRERQIKEKKHPGGKNGGQSLGLPKLA